MLASNEIGRHERTRLPTNVVYLGNITQAGGAKKEMRLQRNMVVGGANEPKPGAENRNTRGAKRATFAGAVAAKGGEGRACLLPATAGPGWAHVMSAGEGGGRVNR